MKNSGRQSAVFNRIRQLLPSPVFPDDTEKTRLASRLNAVTLAILIITLVFLFLALFFLPERASRFVLSLPGLIVFSAVIVSIRLGRIKFAAMLFLAASWLVTTLLSASSGGIGSPLFGFYVLFVMSAVMFSGWYAAVLYAALSLIAGAGMVYLANLGIIEPPSETPMSAWLTHASLMLLITLQSYIIFDDLRQSMQQIQHALTEREKSDAALRESEARFRLISSVTSDFTFSTVMNDQGVLEHKMLSGAFEAISGYTPEEFYEIGGWPGFLHPDDRPIYDHALAALYENQQIVAEVRIITKDGRIRWVRGYSHPIWDAERNRLIGVNGGVQDITEAKAAQQHILRLNADLENKAAQLAALNEIARDISTLTDLPSTLKRVLDKLQASLQFDAFFVALYDPNAQLVTFPVMYDSGQFWNQEPDTPGHSDWITQVLQTGQPLLINRTPAEIEAHTEVRARIGDTNRVSASILMVPLTLGDNIIGALSIQSYTLNSYAKEHIDLLMGAGYQIAIAVENARLYDSLRSELAERTRLETELQEYANRLEKLVDDRTNALRRAKEQLELVLNNTVNALAFADLKGNILVANPAFRAIFSTQDSQSIEFILWSLATEKHMALVSEALLKAIYDREVQHIEAQLTSTDGQEKDVDLTLIPVRLADDGAQNGVLLSGHDITQLKEIERFKARFVADAVHDLATPITGLSTRLYMLQRSPERLGDHVRALENQVQHLRSLLDDLRTLSQIDRGQITLSMEICNLNELVQRVFDTYEPVALDRQQTLILHTDPTLPEVPMDRRQMERVLVNLVSNAINYTPQHKVIQVETAVEDQMVVVRVIDHGIGISAEDLPHVFERFYRANEARTSLSSGTGLGLAITKEIVELHGGSITANSEPGQGSTFSVRLPLNKG